MKLHPRDIEDKFRFIGLCLLVVGFVALVFGMFVMMYGLVKTAIGISFGVFVFWVLGIINFTKGH